MSDINLVKLGSQTARNGFRNEEDVANKFNNWKTDQDAQDWLKTMSYIIKEIEFVEAKVLSGHKTDVHVEIRIKLKKLLSVENLSVKLVSNPTGFNQVDKRRVDKYVDLWKIPADITQLLKLFTGELPPTKGVQLKDSRRMFLNELSPSDQAKIISFFKENKILIVSDILKGREPYSADWMLVILKQGKTIKWCLKNINEVMNIFGKGEIAITNRGSLSIGNIGMQRKGGDGGRETARMLQFKINPIDLFDE